MALTRLNLLVDTLMRQAMVLIGRLSTSRGLRSPVAHLAQQVFRDLSEELRAQGLGNKVIADMFGLTLRAYHGKVRRLEQDAVVRERSLWESVIRYVDERQIVSRKEVIQRFRHDDPPLVAGVLNDLVRSGLIYRKGSGGQTVYRMASTEDNVFSAEEDAAIDAIIWVLVHRHGPATLTELKHNAPALDDQRLQRSLERLEASSRVQATERDGQAYYASPSVSIYPENSEGLEAAIVDHFQAMINTICAKAEQDVTSPYRAETGGTTFHYDLWLDHPLLPKALEQLANARAVGRALRAEITAYNQSVPPGESPLRVTFYVGQHVVADPPESDDIEREEDA